MMEEAIAAIESISTEGNSLSESFDQFETDIDQNNDSGITVSEIETYINSL